MAQPPAPRPPIPFDYPTDDPTLHRIERSEGTLRRVVLSAVTDGRSGTADMIPHADAFYDAITMLELTNMQTMYYLFAQTLRGQALMFWNLVVATIGANFVFTLAAFKTHLQAWVGHVATTRTKTALMNFLRSPGFRRPRMMEVNAYFARVRTFNRYIEWIPDPNLPNNIPEAELKILAFNGCPEAWRNNFRNANQDPVTATWNQIQSYMVEQQAISNERQDLNAQRQLQQRQPNHNNHNNPNQNRRRPADNRAGHRRSVRQRRTNQHQNNNRNLNNNDRLRVRPTDPCPIHNHAHTWGECFLNNEGTNYRPANRNNNNGPRRPQGNNNNNNNNNGRPAGQQQQRPNGQRQQAFAAANDDNETDEQNHMHLENPVDPVVDAIQNGTPAPVCSFACTCSHHDFTHHLNTPGLQDSQTQTQPDLLASLGTMCFATSEYHEVEAEQRPNEQVAENNNSRIQSKAKLRPVTLCVVETVQGVQNKRVLRALVDIGSDSTFVNRRSLPRGCTPRALPTSMGVQVMGSQTRISHQVELDNIMLPELSRTMRINAKFTAFVFDSATCPYDIILGNNFLVPLEIDALPSTQTIHWMGQTTPWKASDAYSNPDSPYNCHVALCELNEKEETTNLYATSALLDKDNPDGYKSKTISVSKYEAVDTDEVADEQKHLNAAQRDDLKRLLRKFPRLFSGKLGVYPHKKIHLELEPNATPVHQRSYAVPQMHRDVFKHELDRLVEIGVLSRQEESEWAAPTFIIPKKDGRVRFISDFRELNKCLKRRVYPLPNIGEVLRRRTGYKFLTKLDISMCYYTFELDDESKDLCTIVTPFGKYKYNRLPMGVKQSPDVAQAIMEQVLQDIEELEVYLDDIGCFSTEWSNHIRTLDMVLSRLEKNGFIINPRKCEWAVQETDFLGHWLTPQGLRPWKKKVDAILKLAPPTNLRELRSFIGAVTYYRDMIPRRSHILAPLTALTGGKKNLFNGHPHVSKRSTQQKVP